VEIDNITYKVYDGIDFNLLKNYKFNEPNPKENSWWQCCTIIDWSSGLGFIVECININRKTGMGQVRCENQQYSQKLNDVLQKLINDKIIYVC
jgi:hypothetical protein